MATNPVKLTIDRQNKRIVVYNGSATAFPPQAQRTIADFEITFVDPPQSTAQQGAFTKVDMSAFSLHMLIGAAPKGDGSVASVTSLTAWTWDAANLKFTGSVPFNVSGVDTLIGATGSIQAYFEINTSQAGALIPVLSGTFALNALLDGVASSNPSPVASYLTTNDSKALFTLRVGEPGFRLRLTSPGSIYGRELGVADDGSAIDNIITL